MGGEGRNLRRSRHHCGCIDEMEEKRKYEGKIQGINVLDKVRDKRARVLL